MKVNIHDYLSCQNIHDLCRQINLPDEVTESVLIHVGNDDFTALNSCFGNLFSPNTAYGSVRQIELFCSENGESVNHGYKIMAVFLQQPYIRGNYTPKQV